ncbi:hypothetical protein BDF14DRAFT_1181703 [Spinellus fusiger]|nr:hypothetical protein BDF14DRAFT_1181703 [Spinellus fusiger]
MPHDALVVLKNDFKRSCLQPSLLFKGSTPDPQPSKSTPVCRLQKRTRSILQSAGAFFSRKASQISAPPSPRLGPTLPHSKPRPFSDFFHIEIKTEAEKRRQSQLDVSLISPLKSLANSSQCSQSDVPTVFSLEESTVSISRSNSIENHVSAMRRITIVDPMAVGTGGAENRRVTIADPLSMEENKRISTVDSLTLDSKRTTPSASPVLNPMKLVNSFDSLVGLSRTSSEITLTDPCAFTPHLPRSVFSKSGDVAKKERRGIQVWQDTCSQLVKDSVPMIAVYCHVIRLFLRLFFMNCTQQNSPTSDC